MLEKKLVKYIKDFELVDLLGFGTLLGVKEQENFIDYVTEIVYAYSTVPLNKKLSYLRLAKDIAANNIEYDKGKQTFSKSVDEAATEDNKTIIGERSGNENLL